MTYHRAFRCRCYYGRESKYYTVHTPECDRLRARWNRKHGRGKVADPGVLEGIVAGSLLTIGALFVAAGGKIQHPPKPEPKVKRVYRCGQCRGEGHNRRSCTFEDAAHRIRVLAELRRENLQLHGRGK